MWRVHQTHRHNQAFRHNAMPLECIFPTSRTWTASRYRKCLGPRLLQKVGLFRLMLNIIVNSNKQSRSNWVIPEDKYTIKKRYLRQPNSSLPSLQSSIPSHLYVSCTHCRRSAHLNCVAEQVMGGQPSSSWLSKQSLSPSHTQDCGMQWPERGHVNWTKTTQLVL